MYEQPEVAVLVAYSDSSRKQQLGPALILLGQEGQRSAALFIDAPEGAEPEGHHGRPAEYLKRLEFCGGEDDALEFEARRRAS